MYQLFKRNEEIRSFQVEDGKVYTTVVIGDFNVTNPTLEQFKSLGWEEYTAPEPEPYIPTLEELVEQYIRNGLPTLEDSPTYSVNQEFHMNRLMNDPQHTDADVAEFTEYNIFVKACIEYAKTQGHK